ncbi:hypothetical protein FHS95_002103 [Sphingomonas naasensis]|uniref:Lipocalin-like domain protein n=1 Tax=Sphingomonas naasensis TaxID=1344951 RepID=A0A4S1WSX7_9SPHN|nr:lipocalin-like domain-containing protein [Sphingomonas naasensis]NIJ20411.1 hypothetical protein [Sphingomonas naasensis]TGX44516.1 lipocalin-like domain protein [Sphingomonas naasensis]
MKIALLAGALSLSAAGGGAVPPAEPSLSLAGTWALDSAYEILADGRRVTHYGAHPRGLLIIDAAGRYSLQIFRPDRARFAAGDKTRGTADEYRTAALGSSTHYGRVRLDPAKHQIIFAIEAASFPNWEGREQVRDYEYRDGVLRYAVPASASGNGTTAFSIWRRVAER